jgi:ATP-dependent Clp protease ATP-binding subunit ClpA
MRAGFDEEVYDTLHAAQIAAARAGARHVAPVHVLFALLADDAGTAPELLRRAGADPAMARALITAAATRAAAGRDEAAAPDHAPDYDRDVHRILERAMALARELHHAVVGDAHLLLALLGEPRRSGVLVRLFRRPEPTPIARDALEASGLTPRAALAHLGDLAPHDRPDANSIQWRRRQN